MAWWPPALLEEHAAAGLEPSTLHSMIDPTELGKRLARIRSDRTCWTDQELDIGVNGVAVPVLDGDALIATISLFGPSYRLNPVDRPTLAQDLLELVTDRAAGLLGSAAT